MADGVDATVDAMQLDAGEHAVLPRRQLRDRVIHAGFSP
jgi:hypothetical protein